METCLRCSCLCQLFLWLVAIPGVGMAQSVGESSSPPLRFYVLDEFRQVVEGQEQFSTRVIVSGKFSGPTLRGTLQRVYRALNERSEFQGTERPDRVVVWAYVSKAHAHSGELWLARLQRTGTEALQIDLNENQLQELMAPQEDRFGLSEKKRREVWIEWQRIRQEARRSAQKKYPSDPSQFRQPGQIFLLARRNSMLLAEDYSKDPIAEMKGVVSLPAGTAITFIKSIPGNLPQLWLYVEAAHDLEGNLGVGWLDSLLLGQAIPAEDVRHQELVHRWEATARETLIQELIDTYGIVHSELSEILREAFRKNWP